MIWAPWRRMIKIDGISHLLYNLTENAADGRGCAIGSGCKNNKPIFEGMEGW
jgi:hypothetical protein